MFWFYHEIVCCVYLLESPHSTYNDCIEDRKKKKKTPNLSPFASWPCVLINPQWLELPISRTNFHGPNDVWAIKVRLYKVKSKGCEYFWANTVAKINQIYPKSHMKVKFWFKAGFDWTPRTHSEYTPFIAWRYVFGLARPVSTIGFHLLWHTVELAMSTHLCLL